MGILFIELLEQTSFVVRGREKKYNITELIKVLEDNNLNILLGEELLITPFYVTETGTYELYWLELMNRLFATPYYEQFEVYIAEMSITEAMFKKRTKEMFNHEVDKDAVLEKDRLLEYFNYIKNSEKDKQEIERIFDEFNERNLYITLY